MPFGRPRVVFATGWGCFVVAQVIMRDGSHGPLLGRYSRLLLQRFLLGKIACIQACRWLPRSLCETGAMGRCWDGILGYFCNVFSWAKSPASKLVGGKLVQKQVCVEQLYFEFISIY